MHSNSSTLRFKTYVRKLNFKEYILVKKNCSYTSPSVSNIYAVTISTLIFSHDLISNMLVNGLVRSLTVV